MKERYYLTELAANLERVLQADVGMEGLETLLHGWIRKGGIKRSTLSMRKKKAGEAYLKPYEVQDLSLYAGYDLTID